MTSEPMRHCVFYWSSSAGGEPRSHMPATPTTVAIVPETAELLVRTYRVFDNEFEARGWAGAYDGEYKLLPLPEHAGAVRNPPQKTMRGNDIRDLQRAQRTMIVPDHDDEQGSYPLNSDNDWTDPWQT